MCVRNNPTTSTPFDELQGISASRSTEKLVMQILLQSPHMYSFVTIVVKVRYLHMYIRDIN